MDNYEIIEYGNIGNEINYVIGGKLKLSDKAITYPDGRKDRFHVIYFDVTTYKDGKIHNNSDKFITSSFDENGQFQHSYKYFVDAYNDKINMIRNEIMIVGEPA